MYPKDVRCAFVIFFSFLIKNSLTKLVKIKQSCKEGEAKTGRIADR